MIRFNIQALLDERGKTRYWLARNTGITHQNITKMARNHAKGIYLETIETLCQVLECTPNDLFVIDFDQPENQ